MVGSLHSTSLFVIKPYDSSLILLIFNVEKFPFMARVLKCLDSSFCSRAFSPYLWRILRHLSLIWRQLGKRVWNGILNDWKWDGDLFRPSPLKIQRERKEEKEAWGEEGDGGLEIGGEEHLYRGIWIISISFSYKWV